MGKRGQSKVNDFYCFQCVEQSCLIRRNAGDGHKRITLSDCNQHIRKRVGYTVELLSKDKILKVMAVTRFHFISGMPMAGADLLTEILDQNPAFTARSDSTAASVFGELAGLTKQSGTAVAALNDDTQKALLRGSLDAVHHSRPLASVVFDNNPNWMAMTYELSNLMPLSRFIFVVRDPEAIATERAARPLKLSNFMVEEGDVDTQMIYLQNILSGPNAERVILIDHDRLMSDPVAVLDVLYRFLRIEPFEHDVSAVETTAVQHPIEPRSLRRIVTLAKPSLSRKNADNKLPVWRKVRRSDALLVLSGT